MRAWNPSILIVWSSLIQVATGYLFGPRQVTGSLGGSVTVSCYYSSISANIHGRKFWCKVHKGQCYTIVSTTPYIKENYINRTYLQDFTNYFMINMTSLQPEDSGEYRCGIGNSNHGFHYPVNLIVSQGKKVPSSSEIFIGRLGGSLVIPCRALARPHNETLYWCKVTNSKSAVCDTIVNSSGKVNSQFWGRVLIQKQSNTTSFNILVNDLRMSDSGFYHCGAYSAIEELDWKDVHVHIINEPTRRKMFRPLSASQSLHVKCQVPKDFGSGALTYWCKWSPMGCPPLLDSDGFIHEDFKSRISLVSDNSTVGRAYTVTVNHLEVGDSGWYWCVATDGLKVASSSMDVIVLATTSTGVYSGSTSSSTDPTSAGTHPADLHPVTELSTVQSISTTNHGGASTISPIQNYSHTVPPSNISTQDSSAVQYSTSSSRGQRSTEFSPMPSNPVRGTDSTQERTSVLFFSPTSRPASSSASSAAAKGMNPSRSSRTQTTHKSGAPSTLGPQYVFGTTRWTENSTLYRQPVSGNNESRNESLVSRHKNLYLILIPVLVIASISILATVFAIHVKGQKKKAANGQTTEPEHIAMIDGEAKPKNAQHNDSNVFILVDPEDFSGETDV
ncbi:polymeric immunoglobulin receptor-like [Lithobates pipiens]